MYISDFFYIWKTNRMTLFCNLFIERPSYIYSKRRRGASSIPVPHLKRIAQFVQKLLIGPIMRN